MNFFDDITKLEANENPKQEPKGEPKQEPKGEPKQEPKGEPKGDPKGEPKGDPKGEPMGEPMEPNNSFTELQAQITELKDLITKLTNKGDNNNDN